MAKITKLSLLVVLSVALGVAAPARADPPAPYELHVIEALTGSLAFVGQAQLSGLEALADYVNRTGGVDGRPLKLVVSDNGTNAQTAVALTNELIAEHVPVILGAGDLASCNAMFPLAKDGPVVYCLSNAASPAPGGYGFVSGAANPDLNLVGIRYFARRGFKRIAELASADALGQLYDRAIDDALAKPENKGLTLVEREHFAPSDVTVQAQLARIKAADPQVIFVGASGNAVGTVFHGLADLGIDVPIATGNSAATYAMMRQYAQILPKDLYFFTFLCLGPEQISDRGTREAQRAYFAALTLRGIRPDGLESISWDPALLLVSALRRIGPNATAAQLRAYVTNLHGWSGVNGPYDFRAHPQRGLGPEDAMIVRWSPEKNTWVAVSKPGGIPLPGR